MKLSAPKLVTWWVAVIVGVVGILIQLFAPGLLGIAGLGFWLVVIAFIIFILGTLLADL